MAIETNYEITYEDLINESLERVQSVCVNVETWSSSVPALLKNGTSETIKSFEVEAETYLVNKYSHTGWVNKAHTSTVDAIVDDNVLSLVSKSTIRQQLEDFLASRGVKVQSNETVTFKNMMAFYNNLASFLSTKLIYVTSLYVSSTCLFYDQYSTNYPSVTLQDSIDVYIIPNSKVYSTEWLTDQNGSSTPLTPVVGKKYIVKTPGDYFNHPYYWTETGYITDDEYINTGTNTQIKTSVEDLMNAMNSDNNIHYAMTNLVYNCCSCSSSSSSSSCSSSSSSSVFIAYMDI